MRLSRGGLARGIFACVTDSQQGCQGTEVEFFILMWMGVLVVDVLRPRANGEALCVICVSLEYFLNNFADIFFGNDPSSELQAYGEMANSLRK